MACLKVMGKKWFNGVFVFLCAALITYSMVFTVYSMKKHSFYRQKLQQSNHQIIKLEKELLESSGVRNNNLIVALRDYVYKNTSVIPSDFDTKNPVNTFMDLYKGRGKMLCYGMSSGYISLLSLYRIRSRIVQLATKRFVNGERQDENDTHASLRFSIEHAKNGLYPTLLSMPHSSVATGVIC